MNLLGLATRQWIPTEASGPYWEKVKAHKLHVAEEWIYIYICIYIYVYIYICIYIYIYFIFIFFIHMKYMYIYIYGVLKWFSYHHYGVYVGTIKLHRAVGRVFGGHPFLYPER